jgi:hypothetical protein
MYLIDASVLIDAKRRYYPFDVVPAFWDWLKAAHQGGKVHVVEKVYDEILAGGDDLATWIAAMPSSFVLATTNIAAASLQAVSVWAYNNSQYTQAAKNDFLSVADYYLVAHAHTISATVVTNETAGTGSRNKIKIPDACNAFGVKCLTPFEMLRVEQATFRL